MKHFLLSKETNRKPTEPPTTIITTHSCKIYPPCNLTEGKNPHLFLSFSLRVPHTHLFNFKNCRSIRKLARERSASSLKQTLKDVLSITTAYRVVFYVRATLAKRIYSRKSIRFFTRKLSESVKLARMPQREKHIAPAKMTQYIALIRLYIGAAMRFTLVCLTGFNGTHGRSLCEIHMH